MAKCDEGYLCDVCGKPVESLVQSALYLRYVLGWISSDELQGSPECHLRCAPAISQFIEHERFVPPVECQGEFDRRNLDPKFSRERTRLISQGYARLWELQRSRKAMTVADYPLREDDK